MIILGILTALLLLVPMVDLVRGRSLRRVAFRNISRRPSEAALVIFGGMLGTAIIAAAFIVGDTFDNSIRDIARTELGPIDQIVDLNDPADADRAEAAVRGDTPIVGVDGIMTAGLLEAAIATVEPSPRAEPSGRIIGIDLAAAMAFGSDPTITGLDGIPSLTEGEVALNELVARDIGASVGDQVEIFAYGQAVPFRITALLPDVGIAGFSAAVISTEDMVALGALAGEGAVAPEVAVLISNDGGVFDSTDDPFPIAAETQARLDAAGIGYEQNLAKAELLEEAELEGKDLRETFIVVGGFSVIAGVLLLINLFVMLAEERKTSLGVLRALGWQRRRLVRSFALEGTIYAVFAAIAGAILGIGVGWVITLATQRIFNGSGDDFTLRFNVVPSSLLTAALVGLVISMAAIWFTSWRISRLNIIRAIRDLPEPSTKHARARSTVFATLGIATGFGLFAAFPGEAFPVLLGPCLAAFSSIVVLKRLIPDDVATLVGGTAAIGWAVGSFALVPDAMRDPDITIFLLQGVILVAGAVAVLSVAGPLWRRLLTGLRGRSGPAMRLGVAYPVARQFRTSLSLAMFSLILFSLTFIGAMGSVFAGQADDMVAGNSAGHDILVRSNNANPLTADTLLAVDGVEHVTTVVRGWARFEATVGDEHLSDDWSLSGIDADFTSSGSGLTLSERSPDYATDAAAFDAVAANPTLVIVPAWFFDDDAPAPDIGTPVTLLADDGAPRQLKMVGIIDTDVANAGMVVSAELATAARPGDVATNRHYVTVSSDVDANRLASELSGSFIEHGADAETFATIVNREVSSERGFFNLLSGYLGLGLIIGIAGLSVVMVRAVRERRAQIGTLRAVGMIRSSVRTVFLTESTFIALQGIVSGVLLGLLSSYQVLTRGGIFEGNPSFVVPVAAIAIIVSIPLLCAGVAAAWPANRAAKLRPADALRLGE